MAELSFTPAQRRLLVAMRKLYLRNLGVLARRRQHLAIELQVRLGVRSGVWLRLNVQFRVEIRLSREQRPCKLHPRIVGGPARLACIWR